VTFIGLHLPSYISDKAVGISFFGTRVSALELGGWAIGLVGLLQNGASRPHDHDVSDHPADIQPQTGGSHFNHDRA